MGSSVLTAGINCRGASGRIRTRTAASRGLINMLRNPKVIPMGIRISEAMRRIRPGTGSTGRTPGIRDTSKGGRRGMRAGILIMTGR